MPAPWMIDELAYAGAEHLDRDFVAGYDRKQGRLDPAVGYTDDDYAEHIRTEFSTYRWLLEPMLDVAGFDIVDVEFSGPFFGAYTCLRR